MERTQEDPELPLPAGFKTIEEVNNMPSVAIKNGDFVNVIGFVKDFQPPFKTNGTDYKCTLKIIDRSTQYDSYGLPVIIFWPLASMPMVTGVKDVLLLRKVKLQMWGGGVQLMVNKASDVHVLPFKQIPTSLSTAARAPWKSYRYDSGAGTIPTEIETRYVMSVSGHTQEMELPSDNEFETRTKAAMTVRDKFSLLKDVENEKFYNILGQVVRMFDSGGDRMTIYLSDYTANTNFYNYAWGGDGSAAGRDGDEYGYIKNKKKEDKQWPGPFGKMTIQMTLFDGHAAYVRNEVKDDQWVFLSNVQIKYGRTGGLLEGFLRGDQGAFEGKIQVRIMKEAEDPDENDARWKEGVRRKYDWWKNFKQQKKNIFEEEAGIGTKRKNDEEHPKLNAKQRRKLERAQKAKQTEESDAKRAARLNLNENIQSTFPDKPVVPLRTILEYQPLLREDKSNDEMAPFSLEKFKANVRVVDYFPQRLEDFAVGHRPSEMDMLSDYSGDEDTDLEEDMRNFRKGKGFQDKVWEWRFALQVEDIDYKDEKDRLWLMVDNHAAQLLLNIEDDAANLRRRENQGLLNSLKEQLFKLWGDLEERKSSTLSKLSEKAKPQPTSSFNSSASSILPRAGGQPDLDSDDDEMENASPSMSKKYASGVLTNRDSNVPTTINGIVSGGKPDVKIGPKNKAFTCCIEQYGVKVDEHDPRKANAGPGLRWQRTYGLFGTQIL